MLEPHFPDGQSYIPIAVDYGYSYPVDAAYTLIAAPVFGSRDGGSGVMAPTTNYNSVAITPTLVIGDNPAGTGGWALTPFASYGFTPRGGVDPYAVYGLATYPPAVTTAGSCTAQLIGGFIDLEVTTTLNGMATVWILDDSNPSLGRRSAILRAQGAQVFDPEHCVKVRDICGYSTLADMKGCLQAHVVPGLTTRRFSVPICPRVSQTNLVGPYQTDATNFVSGMGDTCNVAGGMSAYANPLFGYAQCGAGYIIENMSGTDTLSVIMTIHFKGAIVPGINSTTANHSDGVAVLAQHMLPGHTVPDLTATLHGATAQSGQAVNDSTAAGSSVARVCPVATKDSGFFGTLKKIGSVVGDLGRGVANFVSEAEKTNLGKSIETRYGFGAPQKEKVLLIEPGEGGHPPTIVEEPD